MNKKTKLFWFICIMMLALSLAACGNNNTEPNNGAADNSTGIPTEDGNHDGTGEDEANGTGNSGDHLADEPDDQGHSEDESSNGHEELPLTKTFELILEGMKEEKEATLHEGNGYSLYVFDIFSFNAETNRLSMNYDENYYVDIAMLPQDYDLAALQAEIEAELSQIGEVQGYNGEEQYEAMIDADLFLFARNDKLTHRMFIKEFGGQDYLFNMNIPIGEASEGFPAHAYASINSIVTHK